MDRQRLLVGVDGGGTHCRARVATADGLVFGEARGGSANIFSDPGGAALVVRRTVEDALAAAGLDATALARCHAGLGLAGANVPDAARAFAAEPLPFASYRLASDAVIACLGAHGGADGGIAIFGTGTAYVARRQGSHTVFGGWGLAVSDRGSGADIGRAALAAALDAHDGLGERSALTDEVMGGFDNDPAHLAIFAGKARPGDFGRFAPLVWDRLDAGDAVAEAIVARALAAVEPALRRLLALGVPAISLLGGMAGRYAPLLPGDIISCLASPLGDGLDGALVLAAETLPQ
ncbi:BadF/BadG/BcrA/BcrD ATPase family protein [Aureimonas populi]|uniref:BadF/BadG/BcrA/BcrD ATPase family protein n=1 Tax=Aureimonas populi TaxID=1701758 RepID=A0ABW5CHK9_9HYPH|nr:BadF/BadG/BcrA/BcrD ATPase family protein [Aureimonas populi]